VDRWGAVRFGGTVAAVTDTPDTRPAGVHLTKEHMMNTTSKTLAVKATAVLLTAAALSAVGVGAASAATPDTTSPAAVVQQGQVIQASRSFHVYNQTNDGNKLKIVGVSGSDWATHPPLGATLRNGQTWDLAVNYDVATTNPPTLQLELVDAHGHRIPGHPGTTLTFHVDQWGNPAVTVTDARVGVIPTVHGTNIYIGQTGGA